MPPLRRVPSVLARALVIACLALPVIGRADIDPGELQSHTALKDRKSQDRFQRQIEIDKLAEARREAEEAKTAQHAEEERRRAEAARPWPVRLTEQRCTLCHPAINYTRNAHALPGWWAVALRMKYANKAPVDWNELQVIVPHLAEAHPAEGIDDWIEWALALLLFASPALIAVTGHVAGRLIRRRRR